MIGSKQCLVRSDVMYPIASPEIYASCQLSFAQSCYSSCGTRQYTVNLTRVRDVKSLETPQEGVERGASA